MSVVSYDFAAVLDSDKATATSVTVHAGIPDAEAGMYNVTAVSGAGDGQIGLVGSIAINEVHGTSEASIAEGTAQVSAAQEMVIRAEDLHNEETIATAGVSEDGRPIRSSGDSDVKKVGVGASFAFSDVRTQTKAAVGAGRVVEGLSVYILADNKDVRGTYSIAGKDPAAYGQDFAAAAADGSAAVSIGENRSIALADEGAQIIADGTSDGSGVDRPGDPKAGDIYIKGMFGSNVRTLADMFQSSMQTYSGGTAAVNLAASDAKAEMRGYATANGNVLILADSDDTDETEAVSGSRPADLRRYLARMGLAETMGNALSVRLGEISGKGTNEKNEIAALINAELNRHKEKTGADAANSNPLTYNVLASRNAQSEGTDEENIRKAQEESNKLAASGTNVSVGEGIIRDDLPGTVVRIAAALGLNVTAHNAYALVSGTVDKTNRSVDIGAEVTSSAYVKGSAKDVNADRDDFQNAYGAALSVNRNSAEAEIAKGTSPARVESKGEVSLTAEQLRNVSDTDRRRVEAEADPGYFSNEKGQIFGTLVIVRSNSETKVLVADETVINANLDRKGGDVTVTATETARITAKTMGTSFGPSAIIVDAKDIIIAEVGAKAQVTGNYIVVRAMKQEAGSIPELDTFYAGQEYVSVSATGTDEETVYKVSADTADFARFLEKHSESEYLWGADYLLEALSNEKFPSTFRGLKAQGASVILREALHVSASIGKEAVLTAEGNINIQAETVSKAVTLLGAGDFSSAPIQAEIGTSVVLMTSHNVTETVIGDDARLTAGRYYLQKVMEDAVRTAAVLPGNSYAFDSVSPGGGSIVVLTDADYVLAEVGTGVRIEGALGVEIETALYNAKNSLVSTENRRKGKGAKGENNSYIYSGSTVLTKAGMNSKIRSSKGNVSLTAETGEQMVSIPGANADALAGAIAAVMNIMRLEGSTVVETGKVEITAKGDVRLAAKTASYLIAVDPVFEKSYIFSPTGAVIFFDAARRTETLLGEGSTVTAGGNVWLLSTLDEIMLIVPDPVTGTYLVGLSGLAAGAKSRNIVRTVAGAVSGQDWGAEEISDAVAATSVTADGSIAVTAVLDSMNKVVTAGVDERPSASDGGAAAAVIEKNIVDAIVNTMAYLKAMASLSAITVEKAGTDSNGKKRTDSRTGITLYAGAKEDILMTVEGAGELYGVSVNGTIADVNVANTVRANVGKNAQLLAGTEIKDEFTGEVGDTGTSGDVHIEAEDHTDALILAGGIKKTEAIQESPTVFYGFFGKTVSAKNEGLLAAAKDTVEISAAESTTINSFVTGSGPAGEVSGVSGALDFRSRANAFASGYLRGGKSVNVTSNSEEKLNTILMVRDVAVIYRSTGSALLVYLYNGASSGIADGSTVLGGDVNVTADSNEVVKAYVQGTAGNSDDQIAGGSLMVVLTGSETIARIGANVTIGGANSEKAKFVRVNATNKYTLSGVVGTDIRTMETEGGVSAAASVSYNKVEASVGKNTQMKVWSLDVKADSVRTVNILTAMLGVNGYVRTAGTAAVVAVGSLLTKDAHDAIYAGGSAIRPGTVIRHILTNGGTGVRFNDFKGDPLPLLCLEGILEAGVAGAGETIDMAKGAGKYESILQPEGDAVLEPDTDFYRSLDGNVTRTVTGHNGWEDHISAWIESGAVVEADGGITVSAKDKVMLYVISGAVGSNTKESVGSGTAAVLMNGKVSADVYGTLKCAGMIEILASAEAGKDLREDLSFHGITVFQSITEAASQQGESLGSERYKRGIYVLAVAGAQGAPGGRDNVAYTSVSTKVTARLYGTVKDANRMYIRAVYEFGEVHTISIAAAKGNRDLTRILALEYYDGFVEAGITNTAEVNMSGSVLVVWTISTAAMEPKAGVPGSGTGDSTALTAAAAVNRTQSHAYIAGGIKVNGESLEVLVSAETKSEPDVKLFRKSADICALDMALVLVINAPMNLAYIGRNSVSELTHTRSLNGTGSMNVKTVTVEASLKAETFVHGPLLTNGTGDHLNGLVVIGLANAANEASAAEMNIIKARLVWIHAFSKNNMTLTGRNYRSIANGFGGIVTVGYIGSQNMAELYTEDAVIEANNIIVTAGEDEERVNANLTLEVIPGGAVKNLAKAMNIAAARNDFINLAKINGGENSSKMGVITVRDDVKLYSAMDSLVQAKILIEDRAELGTIGAGAVFARQNGNVFTSMRYTRVTATNIYVRTWFNSEEGYESAGFLREDKGAIAIVTPAQDPEDDLHKHLTSAVALFSGKAAAELYGCDVRAKDTVAAGAFAQSYAKAHMEAPEVYYDFGRIGVNLIHADASGIFKAEVVEPLNNGMLSAKNVDIRVSYLAMSDAMTSAIGGQKVSVQGEVIEHNTAKAYTGTVAEASLKRLTEDDPKVYIKADGKVSAHAYAQEPVFTYERNRGSYEFDIMAVDATAEIAVEQRAHFDPEKIWSAARLGRLEIRSNLYGLPYFREGGDALQISGACAETGYPVFSEDSMKGSNSSPTASKAESVTKAVNLAYIYGPGQIYSGKDVIVAAETGLDSLGGVRLLPEGVANAEKWGTQVSALTKNRTEASIGSYILLVVRDGDETGIAVISTDSSKAEAESLFASERFDQSELTGIVRAGVGTFDKQSTPDNAEADLSAMSVTRSRVGKHTYLEGPHIRFVTVNNNWAKAGMKSVAGYTAAGGGVNAVPTVIAAYCDVEVGEQTTILATQGHISLHTHSYLDSTADASSEFANFLKAENLSAENFIRQYERILIGQGAYLEARFDISVVIRGAVKMEATATNGEKASMKDASTNAFNELVRNEQIDLSKQARLRTWYGDITMNIIASGDDVNSVNTGDHIKAYAYERRTDSQSITNLLAQNRVEVKAHINTWENSEVYAPFGTINIKVQDGYGDNDVYSSRRKIDIEAKAEGTTNSLKSGDGGISRNSYYEDLLVDVKHSTITGRNVNLTASREAMDILSGCTLHMSAVYGGLQTAKAYNDLAFNTDVIIRDGSYVRGYSNVSITAKTESMDLIGGKSMIRAASRVSGGLLFNTCDAVNNGSMEEKISITGNSYIYGRAISMNAIGWSEGDQVEKGSIRGKEESYFDDMSAEVNSIEIDDGSILFVGSMAGAVVDIVREGTNAPDVRQIGLEFTPAVEVRGSEVFILQIIVPDWTPGQLVVTRMPRVYVRDMKDSLIETQGRKIRSRAVSGGALTDTTILNRTGLAIGNWRGIDLGRQARQGAYEYSCRGSNGRAYKDNGLIDWAAPSYPAGGLISEVYYEKPIMGPTATHVGVQRPEGIGNGYTDGARSSVIVYRNNSGRLRTEVHTFDDEREISKKTNPAEGVSDAGS